MLFLLTKNRRSVVNLEKAQNLSIIEKLGIYEIVFFREGQQCVIINDFSTEDEAKLFLEMLLRYIIDKCSEKSRNIITCKQIYDYSRQLETEGLEDRLF